MDVFQVFKNCTSGTKSHNASQMKNQILYQL